MLQILQDMEPGRRRDPAAELRERLRYRVLMEIYGRSGGRCETPVAGLLVGEALGLSREETFRTIHFLAHHGFLDYRGAGPRICITEKGIRFLERDAGRRRSVRDPGEVLSNS
jgi:hypothetical protein